MCCWPLFIRRDTVHILMGGSTRRSRCALPVLSSRMQCLIAWSSSFSLVKSLPQQRSRFEVPGSLHGGRCQCRAQQGFFRHSGLYDPLKPCAAPLIIFIARMESCAGSAPYRCLCIWRREGNRRAHSGSGFHSRVRTARRFPVRQTQIRASEPVLACAASPGSAFAQYCPPPCQTCRDNAIMPRDRETT